MDKARRVILGAMRKVLGCRLPAIIANRRATGRANIENSNTIREGVLWHTYPNNNMLHRSLSLGQTDYPVEKAARHMIWAFGFVNTICMLFQTFVEIVQHLRI